MKKPTFPLFLGTVVTVGSFTQHASAVQDADLRFDTTSDRYDERSVSARESEYPVANQACRAFIEAAVQYHDEISKQNQLQESLS